MKSAFARAGTKFAQRGPTAPKVRRGVSRSAELARVVKLPRRSLDAYDEAFALALSIEMRKPGSDFQLKVKQALMLIEVVEAQGMLGFVGVGGGKTTVAPLFGKVCDLDPVVLLVPPAIKREILERVIPWLQTHIDFKPPHVVSYSELSVASKGDILDRLKPKLIIADEAHNLKNKNAARTKRFLRYFDDNPETVLIALSGTIARRSIMDFHHIIQLTHKGWRCPVTRSWKDAKDWAFALDPHVQPDLRLNPGALVELCRPGEEPREGFRRRLTDTEGVIGGAAEDVGSSLLFRKRGVPVPEKLSNALKVLRKDWETPGGEQVVDALDFARKARELAQGFYYVWDWPDGKPDVEWMTARSEWRKAVANVTKLNREGLDSELLVRNACVRELKPIAADSTAARLPKTSRSDMLEAWKAWAKVMHKEEPETRAIWIDDFLVRDAIEWGKSTEVMDAGGALVWYDARAFGERAAQLGAVVCGAGNSGNARMLDLAGDRSGKPITVFASSNAHGTGKNLQRWSRSLVVAPWSGGGTWEQVIGREHRPGQEADEVINDVNAHTIELNLCIEKALEDAAFIRGVTGGEQKILQGTWLDLRVARGARMAS